MLNTICAIATPRGAGAIAVIRISGEQTLAVVSKIFLAGKKNLVSLPANTVHYGTIINGEQMIDNVIITLFKSPHSYTGEDSIEISCHGSLHIQNKILELLINNGAHLAKPGEFTLRAFLNGKIDLSQAEAVADLIASESEAAHKIALQQLRGGFTKELAALRDKLVNFISLIELELDFSEEEVEFADRKQLLELLINIQKHIFTLIKSFKLGNVLKNGIPVAIIGEPNVGKSTLLNVLLNEEKALVSEIAGTTRDSIEDTINIQGITFRFIDTAGIRQTDDIIENLGIERTFKKIELADIILFIVETESLQNSKDKIQEIVNKYPDKKWIIVINKIDTAESVEHKIENTIGLPTVSISAKKRLFINNLESMILSQIDTHKLNVGDTIITNIRHYEALMRANESLQRAVGGIESNIQTDFLAQDIRQSMHYLGEITGQFTNDEILDNIFKNFCIGK